MATRIADAIELVMHEHREAGLSCLPQQAVGVYDSGVMRLNIDDVGRIAAMVTEGHCDADYMRARNAEYRRAALAGRHRPGDTEGRS